MYIEFLRQAFSSSIAGIHSVALPNFKNSYYLLFIFQVGRLYPRATTYSILQHQRLLAAAKTPAACAASDGTCHVQRVCNGRGSSTRRRRVRRRPADAASAGIFRPARCFLVTHFYRVSHNPCPSCSYHFLFRKLFKTFSK